MTKAQRLTILKILMDHDARDPDVALKKIVAFVESLPKKRPS